MNHSMTFNAGRARGNYRVHAPAISYQQHPKKRGLGFFVLILAIAGLWAGAAFGIYSQLTKVGL
jgi:hypothetical protein